ncbi:MAG: hypothetical protein FWD68_20825 [Alphaproteobacteria bacterium]|nr:hypothetical protein [Alphaproteobacteria bacterium]
MLTNLDPIIYRTRLDRSLVSGWRDKSSGIIVSETDGRLEAVPGAVPAFRVGQPVRFGTALNMAPIGSISRGTVGFVSHIDWGSGVVSIDLGIEHSWLEDQTLTVAPHIDDEALAAIECFGACSRVRKRVRMRIWSALTNPVTYAVAALAAWSWV